MDENRTPVQTVTVTDTLNRAYQKYEPDQKPYEPGDSLAQKLWSVVWAEIGPNAADVLSAKLQQAVIDHMSNA